MTCGINNFFNVKCYSKLIDNIQATVITSLVSCELTYFIIDMLISTILFKTI